jgi:putative polyketide hydroxylase
VHATTEHRVAEIPVLIVGSGPTGLSLALALGRLGVGCILAERRFGVGAHPRATGIRTRTMEIFRSWGLDGDIERAGLRAPDGPEFAWVQSVAGEEIGRLTLSPDQAGRAYRAAASPTRTVFCPQDRVEPILLDEVKAQSSVGIRYSTEVTDVRPDRDGAVATLRDRHTGDIQQLHARYVVACDGASSTVRDAAGIAMCGSDLAAEFVSIYFEADLRPWVGAVPPQLHWIINARSSGGLITLDGRHRWLLQAAQPPRADDDSAWWTQVVRDAMGVEDLAVTIAKVIPWRMKNQVAERFRSGPLLLAGDAAHRFPPTGGFGMNTAIQDAHNLAWKMHAVLAGVADERLLDTYEQERQPIAQFNAQQSVQNAMSMAEAGFGPQVYEIAKELEAGNAETRERIQQAIPRQLPQFDALGQDLGVCYEAGALVSDGTAIPAPEDRQLHFTPNAAPGFRAPHQVLHRDGRAVSTLDLYGESFVLLAAADGWAQAARAAAAERALPIASHQIGADLLDLAGTWPDAYGTGRHGASLVRPDGHVAWRTTAAATDEAEQVVGAVLDAVLCR